MRFRQLLQFRLRTLLIVMVPVVIALGLLGRQAYEARRQREIVRALKAEGFEFTFGGERTAPEWRDTGYTSRVVGAFLFGTKAQQVSDLSLLSEFKNLEGASLMCTKVSDLSPLRELTQLQHLAVDETQVSDLSPLAKLTNLKTLGLVGTQVSDVSTLHGLKSLQAVALMGTRVSDEQVERLQKALPDCKIIR